MQCHAKVLKDELNKKELFIFIYTSFIVYFEKSYCQKHFGMERGNFTSWLDETF